MDTAKMNPVDIAQGAIDLFLEYRDKHGYNEADARAKAITEVVDAVAATAKISAKKPNSRDTVAWDATTGRRCM